MSNHPLTRVSLRPRIVVLLAMVAALSLAAPVAAQAADATEAQYGDQVSQIGGDVGGGGGDQGQPSGLQREVVGGLPFTGLDVIALAAVAVALTSMGLALRRLTAERQPS